MSTKLDLCNSCGGSFDSEECWEKDCKRIMHPECTYGCDALMCNNFFCSDHAFNHECCNVGS